MSLEIRYPKLNTFEIKDFSDTDYVGDKYDQKSTSSLCQLMRNSLILWSTEKQNYIFLSTIESEYISIGLCCAQIIWMIYHLSDYDILLNL